VTNILPDLKSFFYSLIRSTRPPRERRSQPTTKT